jgi:hypothetical protein
VLKRSAGQGQRSAFIHFQWLLPKNSARKPTTSPPAKPPLELGQFGLVYYDGCWTFADSPEGGPDAGNGDLLSMIGSAGTPTAQPVALNPALTDIAFRIDYMAPGPGF